MSYPVVYPPPPNPTDLTAFLRTQAGIPVAALPDDSPYIPDALQLALNTTNADLAIAVPNLYVLAVYNLATDRIINWCPDQAPPIASLTWSSGSVVVTVESPLPASFNQGFEFDTVIAGTTPAGYAGSFGATVMAGSSFSYLLENDPGTATAPGTYLLPFFQWLRASWNINTSVTGVVSSSSDQATSAGFQVPEQLKYLTLSDIQRLKTPFGRAYLEITQAYGQNLFGLT